MIRRIEDLVQDLNDVGSFPIARQSGGTDRRVMRPNRPVVVGHRVVTRLAFGERSYAPTAAGASRNQMGGNRFRPLWCGHTAEQQMARVGCIDLAWGAPAVERDGVIAHLANPEAILDRLAQTLRA